MVEITIGGGGELEGSEADIVEGFVINDHALIGVFNQLMDREGSVVWLNDGVGHLGGWHDWESLHNSVRIFFSDLGDEKGSHSWSSSSSQRVSDLETLEAVASFSFFSGNIEDWVNEFSSFSVMSLGPVVSGSGLSEDKIVRSEKLTEWSCSNRVHCSWLKIHKDSSWDVSSSSGFIVINIDSLKLKIRVTMVRTCGVNTMLIRDNLPELSSDLVTALTTLYVNNLSHPFFKINISYVNKFDLLILRIFIQNNSLIYSEKIKKIPLQNLQKT